MKKFGHYEKKTNNEEFRRFCEKLDYEWLSDYKAEIRVYPIYGKNGNIVKMNVQVIADENFVDIDIILTDYFHLEKKAA